MKKVTLKGRCVAQTVVDRDGGRKMDLTFIEDDMEVFLSVKTTDAGLFNSLTRFGLGKNIKLVMEAG